MGYAQEYHVERYLRESLIPRTAPVSPHMICRTSWPKRSWNFLNPIEAQHERTLVVVRAW
jgi:hypothetical protein